MQLWLEDLSRGIPVILPDAVQWHVGWTVFCFEQAEHTRPVHMTVVFKNEKKDPITVNWQLSLTVDHRRAYNDRNKAVENGAITLALLLIRELTEYTAFEVLQQRQRLDYRLVPQSTLDDDFVIFNEEVFLEVSGILAEQKGNTVSTRLREKRKHLTPAHLGLSASTSTKIFVAVVAFRNQDKQKPEAQIQIEEVVWQSSNWRSEHDGYRS